MTAEKDAKESQKFHPSKRLNKNTKLLWKTFGLKHEVNAMWLQENSKSHVTVDEVELSSEALTTELKLLQAFVLTQKLLRLLFSTVQKHKATFASSGFVICRHSAQNEINAQIPNYSDLWAQQSLFVMTSNDVICARRQDSNDEIKHC